ncbi:MAG: TRAP-type uncharacterized transport system substrate-binding protein [Planctomycetota bacterium]|jgi:TRAP-type uncharacterized transport system substrate-binding protein
MRSWNAHRLVALAVLAFAVASVGVWIDTRERLPDKIRIATAVQGGLYDAFPEELKTHIEERTGRVVDSIGTAGSIENQNYLDNGTAELAILQAACA